MTEFEYLSVLLSVILGLAITQILEGYRALLLARRSVRPHVPSFLWSVLILLFVAQSWWASFGLERQAEWRFSTFLVILLQMAPTYLLAALVLPDVPGDRGVDLPAHYERQRRPFFLCLLAVVLVSLAKEWLLEGRLPVPLNLAFHVLLGAAAALGAMVRRPAVHMAVALFVVMSFALYVGLLFARLQVGG